MRLTSELATWSLILGILGFVFCLPSLAGIVCAIDGRFIMMVIAFLAAALAMINVAGGFAVTHKMLRMFNKKNKEGDNK
jgi:NAD/NADP transhydrogenase alpha subunit